jgi:ATP-binding cassette subfamily C protein
MALGTAQPRRQGIQRPAAAALAVQGRRTFIAGLVYAGALSGFITLLQLTVPLFMIQVHDRVVNSRSYDTLTMLILVAAGALILFGVLEFIRITTFQAMASALVRRLNLPTIEAALASSLESGSARAAQALRDLSDLRTFITSNAIAAPLEVLWCPMFILVMFLLHPLYGLLGIICVGLLFALSLLADLLTRGVLKEANSANAESIARIGSTLRHAEAIEAMGMLPALSRRWRDGQHHAVELLNIGHLRGRGMHTLTRMLRYGMQISALSLGAALVIEQATSPGAMIGATIILNRLLGPIDSLTGDWRQWVFAQAAWGRVRELLESHATARETQPTPRSQGDLEVEKLVFAARGSEIPILKGLSFALSPGEVLGVVGPSAAGKSTLARLLVGAAKPTAGGVFLAGHNVYLWERGSFGEMAGYLPQSVSLLDGTIRDNIARMRDVDPRLVIEAARLAGVHDMIGRLPLGYDTPVGDGRFTLSGGQKQRIALARALFGRPRLLVLDEPNANLDTDGENALMQAIDAMRDDGAIVVLIAHRPAIMQCADKLLVLQDGRVAQFGERTSVVSSITPRGEPTKRGAASLVVGGAA